MFGLHHSEFGGRGHHHHGRGKDCMANPLKSGSAYAQVYGLYKLYGWDGLTKLINNVKILDSSSLVYKGTAEGEFALGITMTVQIFQYIGSGDFGPASAYGAILIVSVLVPLFLLSKFLGRDLTTSL